MRISGIDQITAIEVFRRINKEDKLIETIKSRKLQYLGLNVLNDNFFEQQSAKSELS